MMVDAVYPNTALSSGNTFFNQTHIRTLTQSIMCPVKKKTHLETLRDASFLWVDRYLFRDTDVFKVSMK